MNVSMKKLSENYKVDEKFLEAMHHNEGDKITFSRDEMFNKCKENIWFFFYTVPCEMKQGLSDLEYFNMNYLNYIQISNLINKKSTLYDIPVYSHGSALRIAYIAYQVIFNNCKGEDFIIFDDSYIDFETSLFIRVYNRICEQFLLIPDKKHHPKFYSVHFTQYQELVKRCRGCCNKYVFINVQNDKKKMLLNELHPVLFSNPETVVTVFNKIGDISIDNKLISKMKFNYNDFYSKEQMVNINAHLAVILDMSENRITKKYKFSEKIEKLLKDGYTIDNYSLTQECQDLCNKDILINKGNYDIVIGVVKRVTSKAIHIYNQNFDYDQEYINLIKDKIAVLYCETTIDDDNKEIIIDSIKNIKLEGEN